MSKYDTPIATIDIILMTLIDNVPHVMLSKRGKEPFKDKFSLIGGFIFTDKDKAIEDTFKRVVKNKIGVENIYFEQLETIGSATRDPRGWSISISFVSLLPSELALKIKPHESVSEVEWVSILDIEKLDLAFDHKDIINSGFQRIKTKINYSTLPIYLLPEFFTITQLQEVYEAFLGVKIDKSGFRKKIKDIPFLKETNEVTKKNHRPAKLYTAKEEVNVEYFRSNIIV